VPVLHQADSLAIDMADDDSPMHQDALIAHSAREADEAGSGAIDQTALTEDNKSALQTIAREVEQRGPEAKAYLISCLQSTETTTAAGSMKESAQQLSSNDSHEPTNVGETISDPASGPEQMDEGTKQRF
jgi:hypothetical protein